MGRRGPAPTPTKLKLLRGETRPSRINQNEPEPADNQPVLSLDMDPASRVVWLRVMGEFGHTGVIKALDTDVLRMYCDAVARYEEASRLLGKSGPIVKGARTGDVVKNPMHQIVRDNASLVQTLARELGLTPAARTGLTWQSQPGKARSALDDLRVRRARLVSAAGRPAG